MTTRQEATKSRLERMEQGFRENAKKVAEQKEARELAAKYAFNPEAQT